MKRIIGSLVVVGTVAACSGGGGGGGGSSSEGLGGTMQVAKATCNNKSCITGGSVSLMSLSDADIAGNAYAELNSTVIPAMNGVVARIENGIAEAGVSSCDFIGDDDGDISNGMNADLPFEGTTEAGATTYKVQTSNGSIHSLFKNPVSDDGVAQPWTFTKKITAKDSTGAFMTLDLVCNDVDQWEGSSPDTRPLVAKVLMIDRATGNKINAFYMKGATRSRLLLVGKIGSKNYKVYFTTTPYTATGTEFHISFADGTHYMNVSGRNFPSDMSSTEIIGSVNGNANTCFTSNGCPNVVSVRGTLADASELITGGVSWTDAVVDDSKLIAPAY